MRLPRVKAARAKRMAMPRNSVVRFAVSLASLLLIGGLAAIWAKPTADSYLLYVGTLTGKASAGIYAYRFHPDNGQLEFLGLAAQTPDPTFVAVHPNQKFLYAVNESPARGPGTGNTVAAFRIDGRSGKLVALNAVSSAGTAPCHLAVSRDGKVLVVTNCGNGSVAVFPIRENGSLAHATAVLQHHGSSANSQRQKGPHAHCVIISRDSKRVFVADLGVDKIFMYHLNSDLGSLDPADPAAVSVRPGAGVRHLALHPNGKFLYAISELDSTLTVFRRSGGTLNQIQVISALPDDAPPQIGGSEVELDAKAKFLYASIRGGQNSIAVFAVDEVKGVLRPLQHISTGGRTPRQFAIDPTGAFLFAGNQNSHSLVIFQILANGLLRPAQRSLEEIDSPACIAFVESHPG
jgi:6-phosphogluconolactonase